MIRGDDKDFINKSDYDFTKFTSLNKRGLQIEKIINRNKSSVFGFGLDYLDRAMVGFFPNDLVLLGGRSGAGKTELALHIACSAATKYSKKVYYFALEAEREELSMRLVYREVATRFFADRRGTLNYEIWSAGHAPKEVYEWTKEIADGITGYKNLHVRYAKSDFTIEDFVRELSAIKHDADLIVLDHLHYFELRDGENENSEYKRIVKLIRSECLDNNIPVLLVSHIRKPVGGDSKFVPDQEDFHGSSDIVKISTKAITIASSYGKPIQLQDGSPLEVPNKSLTFVKVAKNRRNGAVCFETGIVMFDTMNNVYDSGFFMGKVFYDNKEKRSVFVVGSPKDYPAWSRR